MNHPAFTKFRRLIDEAITFNDLAAAKKLIRQGLALAEQKECLGEMMYFKAQDAIVEEDLGGAIVYLDKAIASTRPCASRSLAALKACANFLTRVLRLNRIMPRSITIRDGS